MGRNDMQENVAPLLAVEPCADCKFVGVGDKQTDRQTDRHRHRLMPSCGVGASPCDAHHCHMGTTIKHPVQDRVKPSFVIFDHRAL